MRNENEIFVRKKMNRTISFNVQHTVEKIGGTSMSDYQATRDNIYLSSALNGQFYQRIFVVSAYAGITNLLLEHKKTGEQGVYALFADNQEDTSWKELIGILRNKMLAINKNIFINSEVLIKANTFIVNRLDAAEHVLIDLSRLCKHGHFTLANHLLMVREMLASLGEIHSAYNTSELLQLEGLNACFVDLSGWDNKQNLSLDQHIIQAFTDIDLSKQLPIVTGYCHCEDGLMESFDRGYSEMTFSRIAVLTNAKEAIIHKEFHLSSADPRLVGECNAVPIGRTNYDVADQLANIGMEAIHPRAAKGLSKKNIDLRVKNTFDPNHSGTLISNKYISDKPCVEIIAGCKGVYALELFDQYMVGLMPDYEQTFLKQVTQFKGHIINKDFNANTITYYLHGSLKTVQYIKSSLENIYRGGKLAVRKVCMISVVGSNMKIPGILAKTTQALADVNVSILAIHQSMRQVDMQFILDEEDYEVAVKSLHSHLVEVHNHGLTIACI